jgi:hypothetical protein
MTEQQMILALRAAGYRVTRPATRAARPKGRRHRHCAEHVRMDGYREPVCILTGQDRAEVLAFAREMAALAPLASAALKAARGPREASNLAA